MTAAWLPCWGFLLAWLTVCSWSEARADDAAVGRKHAQRASHLAAAGKCKQAIVEYDRAIAVLRDPALLFNRGECHRKMGDADAALADYSQFLNDLPNAPNRAQVQARIAELKKGSPVTAAPAISTAPKVIAGGPAGTGPTSGSRKTAEPPPRPAAPPLPVAGAVPEPPTKSPGHSVTTEIARPLPAAVPRVSTGSGEDGVFANGLLVAPGDSSQAVPESNKSDGSIVKKPWFWIVVGAVVVGAGVATYFVVGRGGTTIPSSDLGNYKF